MNLQISGIHHVTAIATDPVATAKFYRDVLGLRLVKKTVNFDDPGTYHFYFGDSAGHPGTLMTLFPNASAAHARPGHGVISATAFSVPIASLDFWKERLARFQIPVSEGAIRFAETLISSEDQDAMTIEIVARSRGVSATPWIPEPDLAGHAITGIDSVTIQSAEPEQTGKMLTEVMGFRSAGHNDERQRFETGEGGSGSIVDVVPAIGLMRGHFGAGSVHHVAFRALDDQHQLALREKLLASGVNVTEVLDRQYFHSIYFREPGGVIFEIATDPPGFTTDETLENLGSGLKLPPWLEEERAAIEGALVTV